MTTTPSHETGSALPGRLQNTLIPRLSNLHVVAVLIALLLFGLLVIPVTQVIFVAFQDPATGAATLQNFADFFATSLFRESFWNSFYVSAMSVVVATIIALPLAYITTRFNFSGSIPDSSLGFIPLIMPPFVGAVAMQLIFGRNGTINLLLRDHVGISIPFMDGLNGVILVQSIHYFPFILINLSPRSATSTGQWRKQPRILAVTDCGSFGASFSRWQCQDISPALRWCSSRFLTTWAHRCC